MVQVNLAGLTKRFGETMAVEGIDFAVKEGELLTLVGPSGCGKTTILRLIAGFEQPDAGEILFDGKSMLKVPPEARRVGMVFQNYALFPHMNVTRNIAYGIRFRREIDSKRRVGELLRLVGLEELAERRPAELSAGQKQRVALARALAPYPRLLLLDEPLSALDAKLREGLRTQIRRIQRELGVSTLYVTHDQEEALAISDRIAVMSRGRIEQTGTPQDVYMHPQSPFVASFIGRSNRLEGVVRAIEDGSVSVEVGDLLFDIADHAAGVTPRDRVSLFIKEEHLRLETGERNIIPAKVVALEYRGDSTIVHLESPVGSLRARLDIRAGALGPDDRTKVGFSPEEAILFAVSQKRGGTGREEGSA